MRKGLLFLPFFLLFFIDRVAAHCPLCTAGAAVAAGGAVWLGVKTVVVGIFIGAFAVATGWWVSNLIKKQVVWRQKELIILASFLLTVIPIIPLFPAISPIPILWTGDYGSLLNRTYLVNQLLLGSIIGGFILFISPTISTLMTRLRKGNQIPFQGIIITFVLLLLTGLTLQVVFV